MQRITTPVLTLALTWLLLIASVPAAFAGESASPVIDRILREKQLVVGTAGNMPPLNMTTKDGQIIGLEPDLAKMMADAMGVKLKLKKMPFSELLGALEAGEIEMVLSGMTMTPERNLKVAFVGPYMVSGKCFLTKISDLASTKDPSQMKMTKKDITLAALKGSTSQYFVEKVLPQVKLVTVTDYDEGVSLVMRGKVDAMVADYTLCAVANIRYPHAGFASAYTKLTYEPLGIALPANDPLLMNWVDNLMSTLQATHRLEALQHHWFEDNWWLKELP